MALSSSADPANSGPKRLIATVPEVVGMLVGGEGGIRTLGTFDRTHAFQACSLSHSDTSPFDTLLWQVPEHDIHAYHFRPQPR